MNKSVEEQPRYVIDQDQPERDVKILPEEQKRVLTKLLQAGGHAINEEERELIGKLQDKLQQEVERIRSLRKMKVADKPLDAYLGNVNHKKRKPQNNHAEGNQDSHVNDSDSSFEQSELEEDTDVRQDTSSRRTSVVGFKPEEVVQRYIECWNQQKFGAEFDCFSSEYMKVDRQAYVEARHNFYRKQLQSGGMRIDFGEIKSSETFGGAAEVIASKVVRPGNRKPQEETDIYRLKIEKGHWVISSVEPQG